MIKKAGKFLFYCDGRRYLSKSSTPDEVAMARVTSTFDALFSERIGQAVRDAYAEKRRTEAERLGIPIEKVKVRWGRKPMLASRKIEQTLPDGTIRIKRVFDIPIDANKILEMRRLGKTIAQIADDLHISVTPVKNVLKEAGIE